MHINGVFTTQPKKKKKYWITKHHRGLSQRLRWGKKPNTRHQMLISFIQIFSRWSKTTPWGEVSEQGLPHGLGGNSWKSGKRKLLKWWEVLFFDLGGSHTGEHIHVKVHQLCHWTAVAAAQLNATESYTLKWSKRWLLYTLYHNKKFYQARHLSVAHFTVCIYFNKTPWKEWSRKSFIVSKQALEDRPRISLFPLEKFSQFQANVLTSVLG